MIVTTKISFFLLTTQKAYANFSTFNFASLLDLLSVFFSTSSFVSTNSLNFYLTSDA